MKRLLRNFQSSNWFGLSFLERFKTLLVAQEQNALEKNFHVNISAMLVAGSTQPVTSFLALYGAVRLSALTGQPLSMKCDGLSMQKKSTPQH